MKGTVAKRPPLAEVTNKNNTLKTSNTQEIASTSSYVQVTTTALTSSLKVTKPKRTQFSTRIPVLKKKLKSLNIANEKYTKRLKEGNESISKYYFLESNLKDYLNGNNFYDAPISGMW
ncbi:unnamed protein product [Parnassius apollo]|uniref:(apollo) hypothetical protein n=1 Tax=Parnassius apollo TaxID=110799 RepID=A0A8S3W354_PARAO|nr:unnamed protein product [Parnassius apollo]